MILPESFCCQCDIEVMYSNKCNGLPNENDMAQKLNCKSLYSFVNSSKSFKAFKLQFVDISYLNKGKSSLFTFHMIFTHFSGDCLIL